MRQNDQHLYEGSRWVLYHGASTVRLKRILEQPANRRSHRPVQLKPDRTITSRSCLAVQPG